jgi:hypothetical protein
VGEACHWKLAVFDKKGRVADHVELRFPITLVEMDGAKCEEE